MTWSLCSDKARQVFNCWNTCVKLAWGVPRSTHSYLVDALLSSGIPSVRASLLACYWKFAECVRTSASLEVRVVACLASGDIRSTTGSNSFGIRKLCNIGTMSTPSNSAVKGMLLQGVKSSVPDLDSWRIGCLRKYLDERYQLQAALQSTSEVDSLIDSICSS